MCHYIKPSVPEICDASHLVSRCWMNHCISWRRHLHVSLYVPIWVVDNWISFEYFSPVHSMHVSPRCGLNLAVTSLTYGDKNEQHNSLLSVFTRGQFWPSGIVVACVCLSVCPSVCAVTVRAITHHPFELGSPNLDHRCKRPWLRSLLFWGVIDLDLQGQI